MSHRRELVLLLVMVLLMACGPASPEGQPQGPVVDVDALDANPSLILQHPYWSQIIDGYAEQLGSHVSQDNVGGIAAGVVVGGEMVWAEGFGWADRADEVEMTPSAIFRTGAVSRAVTAVLLMRLVDKGIVVLDEPVARHLPELSTVRDGRPEDPEVTFRHLASHTSGLERNYREGLAGEIDGWAARVLRSLERVAFDSGPGDRYQDSPIGYGVLGLALQRAAGESFEALVEREVFEPLGMTASAYVVAGTRLEEDLATAYPNLLNGKVSDETGFGRFGGGGYVLPSGGVFSTVGDLGRLMSAVAGPRNLDFLSEASRQELISAQTPGGLDPPRGEGYPPIGPRLAVFRDGEGNNIRSPEVLDPPQGLAFAIHVDRDGHKIAHIGGIAAGYTAYIAVDTETGIGVVMLRNYWRGMTDLRKGSVGLVSQLTPLVRGETHWWTLVPPAVTWFAGAVLLGALFNATLGRPLERTRRRIR
jgi:CubicO group peptidase (beta-lactamase class C family)